MGWRAYGEPEPEDSFIAEFLIGGLWGMMSVYSYGWAFVWLGWMTANALWIAGLVIGLLAGIYCGWSFTRSTKEKNLPKGNGKEPYEKR